MPEQAEREIASLKTAMQNYAERVNEQGEEITDLQKKLEEANLALQGRTVSCIACNEMAKKLEEAESLFAQKKIECQLFDVENARLKSKLAVCVSALKVILKHGGDIGQNCTEQNIAREALEKVGEQSESKGGAS